MAYYHDLITDKSWKILQELKSKHKFILIGGWAVFLYTKTLKSKDVDIICEYEELEKFKEYHELRKNDRLEKYEISQDGIDIDIYVPFFSNLGAPTERLIKYTTMVEGFTVLTKEALLITKIKAWLDRQHSLKGEKDKIDIIALLQSGVSFEKFKSLLVELNIQNYITGLRNLLNETREILQLNLNVHKFAKLKKKIIDSL